jgi:LuxR family transcriptional regulator, maltose regulon positive regulatory protein
MKVIHSPKIMRPSAEGLMPRQKLLGSVDNALGSGHLWVSAPAGSGKTSLASNYAEARKACCVWYQMDAGDADPATFFYFLGLALGRVAPQAKEKLPLLTPEYLLAVPTFARRFFEQFYCQFESPAVVVFDNYQELQADAGIHELFGLAIASCPAGVKIIVLSRESPPPILARLVVEGKLQVMGWEDIRLTRHEADEILQKHDIDQDAAGKLHSVTEGWVAGLLFLLRRFEQEGCSSALPDYSIIFDYFSCEVLGRLETEVVDFLCQTACLPAMTSTVAERLTGNAGAGGILRDLHRKNCFI